MSKLSGKNVLTKVLALILATILWLYVTNEQNPSVEISYQVPLEVRNLAEDVVVLDAPETVKIKLRGPRSVIAGIQGQDLKAYVDLKGLSDGKHTIQVALMVPHAMETVEVNPDKVTLRLDKIITKQLPVEIRMSGELPNGLVVTKFTPSAERVSVEGPKTTLDTASKVVGSIDAKGHAASFSTEVQLAVINSEGQAVEGLEPHPGRISVAVQLAQGKLKKLVDIKAVMSGEPANGFVLKGVKLTPDKIEITGDPQLVEKLESVNTEPINLANINKDAEGIVKLQLPEGITIEKDSVTAHISVMKKP